MAGVGAGTVGGGGGGEDGRWWRMERRQLCFSLKMKGEESFLPPQTSAYAEARGRSCV